MSTSPTQDLQIQEIIKYINAPKRQSTRMSDETIDEKESVAVLRECIELQLRKSADYQSDKSTVRQADYYPSGCRTILEIMHAKMLRIKSLIEADQSPNFECIEDSAKDLINYASFFCSYARGKMDGQDLNKDFLNRKKVG